MARSVIQSRARFIVSGYSAATMRTMGERLANEAIRPRIQSGKDVYDNQAPPLKQPGPGATAARLNLPANRYMGYPARKIRKGQKPIRNWTLSGLTMRALGVLSSAVNRVTIGFSDPVAQMRAAINNRRWRQFGLSPKDQARFAQIVRETPESPVKVRRIV